MTKKELYEWCKSQVLDSNVLIIPDEIFNNIDEELSNYIVDFFPKTTLFKLPNKEIAFFEWLKKNDSAIWHDLWLDELNQPYIVSLIFLPVLIKSGYRGFPICDLLNNENYYFAPAHLADKESEIFAESSKTRFANKQSLTVPQLLAIEISMQPIDIWHFAFKHKIELSEAKKAVDALVKDEILVHLKDAEYLSNFIEF